MSAVAAIHASPLAAAPGRGPVRAPRAHRPVIVAGGEHGAYAIVLAAALGGGIAAAGFGAASLAALAAVALAVPARREALLFARGAPLAAVRPLAAPACAVAFLAALLLAPGPVSIPLAAFGALGAALALAHLAATVRLGARDGAVELAGGALAALAGPVIVFAGGGPPGAGAATLLAFGVLLAAHAAARVVVTRRAFLAWRGGGRSAVGVVPELVSSVALVVVAGALVLVDALASPALLVAAAGPAVALAPPARSARGVGVREVIVGIAGAVAAGVAARLAG